MGNRDTIYGKLVFNREGVFPPAGCYQGPCAPNLTKLLKTFIQRYSTSKIVVREPGEHNSVN
jgi:hypothetical protein